MPTLTAVRGESKKREAGANVDFSAIWSIHGGGLLQDEVTDVPFDSCVDIHA